MGWIILIVFIDLLIMGFAHIFGSAAKIDRDDSDQRSADSDDQMSTSLGVVGAEVKNA
jgi:hypothetical protein